MDISTTHKPTKRSYKKKTSTKDIPEKTTSKGKVNGKVHKNLNLDISQAETLIEVYQERFLESNIKIHLSKMIGKEFHLEIELNNEIFSIVVSQTQILPKRFHMNDIQISKLINHSYPLDILEFYEKLFFYITSLKKYCISCQKILEVVSDQYITCGDMECSYKMEEMPLNPIELIQDIKNLEVISVLLDQAFSSVQSSRNLKIFEPYPFFLLEKDNIKNPIQRGQLSALISNGETEKVNQMKNMEKIKQLLSEYKNFLSKAPKYKLDEEIIKDFGLDFYKLIKFIVQSNKARIEKEFETKGYSIYKFTHGMDIEEKMKEKTSNVLLFHGSPSENWYSIIRNGLKVTSNSTLMTNGAAHGTGLYFSNDVNLSYSYCKHVGVSKDNKAYMGVYQLYDDLTKYKKTNNIYVVNDSQIVLLRYLVCFEKQIDTKTGSAITEYFNKTLTANKKLNTKVNSRGVLKLMKELGDIAKRKPEELGFEVETDEDDIYKWYIYFRMFDDKSAICKDMKKYKIKEIKMEMIFPESYPFEPPFVHIMNPRFQYQTGHITSEGAICMELLTPSGWTPVQNIESLLIQIKALIIEGDGRLDEKRWNQPYSLQEAKKSFERVARGHGWLK
jgi:ubiquitin-protein ligase